MIAKAVVALLFAVALFPPSGFSDFDRPKWAAFAIFALIAVFSLARRSRQGALRHDGFFGLALLGIVAAAFLCLLSRPSLALPWQPCAMDLFRLAMPILVAHVLAQTSLDERSWRIVVSVGALCPAAVLLAGVLSERGILAQSILPHDPGLGFTATYGNTGLTCIAGLTGIGFATTLLARPRGAADRMLAIASAAAALTLALRTGSRTLYLAGAAVAVVAIGGWFIRRRQVEFGTDVAARSRGSIAAAIAVVIVIGLAAFPPTVTETAETDSAATIFEVGHASNEVRLGIWHSSRSMIADHPFVGVGGGRFGEIYPLYRGPEEWALSGWNSIVVHPHGEWVRVITEYGIAGTILAVAALAGLLTVLMTIVRGPEARASAAALGAVVSLAVLLASGLVWDSFRQPGAILAPAVLLGLALADTAERAAQPARRRSAFLAVVVAGPLLIAAMIWLQADRSAGALFNDLSEEIRSHETVMGAETSDGAWSVTDVREIATLADGVESKATSAWVDRRTRVRLLLILDNLAAERRRLMSQFAEYRKDGGQVPEGLDAAIEDWPSGQRLRDVIVAAIELSPSSIVLHRMRARHELREGRISEGITALEHTLSLSENAPEIRSDLADIHFSSRLYDRGTALLREELRLYPSDVRADEKWERLIRITGSAKRLLDALDLVDDWVAARGDSDIRRRLAGELVLHFGETPETIGLFFEMAEDFETCERRGHEMVGSMEGADPNERARAYLVHLGRHPFDVPVMSALVTALTQIIPTHRGEAQEPLRVMRKLAGARSRVLYAWDDLEQGEMKSLERNLRLALRQVPNQGDAILLDILHHLRAGDRLAAEASVRAWRETGFADFQNLARRLEPRPALRETGIVDLLLQTR